VHIAPWRSSLHYNLLPAPMTQLLLLPLLFVVVVTIVAPRLFFFTVITTIYSFYISKT